MRQDLGVISLDQQGFQLGDPSLNKFTLHCGTAEDHNFFVMSGLHLIAGGGKLFK